MGEIPRAVTILAYAGLGVGAAGGAVAAQGFDRRLEWLVRVGIALVIAALGGTLADGANLLEPSPLWPVPEALHDALRVGSWLSLVCAVVVAAIPPGWARRAPVAVALVAVVPFLVAMGLYLVPDDVRSVPQLGFASQGSIALNILSLVAALAPSPQCCFCGRR